MGSNWKIPWPQTCIDKEEQLIGVEIKLPQLAVHYSTFRVRRAGEDRLGKRKYNNRIGKQTDLGDLEIQLWRKLVAEAIEKSGQKQLYNHLLAWIKIHDYAHLSKEEREDHAMELFTYEIFNEPLWVDFIPFNRKYRPEYLDTVDLVTVVNPCCRKPYQIARKMYEAYLGKECCCEYCGRYTPFRIVGGRLW